MEQQAFYYAKMKTPLGVHLWIAKSARGVCRIEFGYSEPAFRARLRRIWLEAILIHDAKALRQPLAELQQYFAGRRRAFTFRQLMIGTAFQQLVWEAVNEIPFGRVATYKSIAGLLKIRKERGIHNIQPQITGRNRQKLCCYK
jgi:O6-methylguanine-DNA--protein-cysteine methyltransferase